MVSVATSTPPCGLCAPTCRLLSRTPISVRDLVTTSQSSSFGGNGSEFGSIAVMGFGLKGSVRAIRVKAERQQGSQGPGQGVRAPLFPFLLGNKDKELVKKELLDVIAPLERGAKASDEDIARVDKIARELEALNPTKDPLKSPYLNGKWELLYTTSSSILKKERPKFLRPNGAIYQAINADTLRAQNLQTWPYFNQVTATLEPVNSKKVIVKFDYFKIGGLISVKAPGRARGELEITYLDDELRLSRGDKGNLFVLIMDDPTYRIPL